MPSRQRLTLDMIHAPLSKVLRIVQLLVEPVEGKNQRSARRSLCTASSGLKRLTESPP